MSYDRRKKIYHFAETLSVGAFGKFSNTVLNKNESDKSVPFTGSYVLSPTSDEVKLLLKYFPRFLILMIQVSIYLLFLLKLN